MIRICLPLFLALISSVAGFGQGSTFAGGISLNGVWDYQPVARTVLKADGSIVEDKSNLPSSGKMQIPSNWHLSGLENFNGRVRFERSFDFTRTLAPGERAFLVFHGVDYFAGVSLNGNPVGKHEGYFQTFEFDVTSLLRRGRNQIVVTVDAPLEEPGLVWPDHKRMIKGVFSHWDCKPGSVSREFGQDGTTAGIWNNVELETRRSAWLGTVKIQPFLFRRELASGNRNDTGYDAKVYISAEVHSSRPGRYRLTAEAGGSQVSQLVDLSTSSVVATLVLPMEHPHLWWTWDMGEPYLYTCRLALESEGEKVYSREIPFGVRSIQLDERTGEWRLNGVRFFIRGTNIVPDLWLARYAPDRIARDIRLLKDAYVNGVRVCVHVNREELYDALDRAGIVAWQDFPLQWDYAHTTDFTEEAARQLRDMIRQFYNHPSIITWVCQNESTAYNVNVLDPFLARVGAQEDSSRPVRPVAAFAEHLYEGWYAGDYRNYQTLPGGPIISELGAQAFPSLEETEQMFGSSWPPDWKKLAYHDFQYDQTFHVARIGTGSGWKDFVENSQRYQARLLKFAIEHYRRAKYRKVGSFFQFQFVDCWPSVTWSVVSFERKPKPGYFAMQQAYQPVLVGAELDRTVWSKGAHTGGQAPEVGVHPWVVNDKQEPIPGVTCQVLLSSGGKEVIVGSTSAATDIPADGVIDLPSVGCAPPSSLAAGDYELILVLKQRDQVISRNSYGVTVAE